MSEPTTPDLGEVKHELPFNETDTPTEREIVIRNKVLYHGSATPGIKTFNVAEEDTIGSGIYFTSEDHSAIGYARRRSRRSETARPVVYKVTINEARLANLENDLHVRYFMNGFKEVLQAKLTDPDLPWYTRQSLEDAISKIEAGKITSHNIREATFSHTKSFSEYLASQGYDGLLANEGGEGEDVRPHDSYVIFNPEKISIIQEQKVT